MQDVAGKLGDILIYRQLVGTAVTLLVYRWKKQMILSMAAGTAVYMILVQVVFA